MDNTINLHDDDWELLDHSTSDQTTAYLHRIEQDYSEGMIKSDYFSIDSNNFSQNHVDDVTDHVSVESDNPSWIDPVCEVNYSVTKPAGEVSSTDSDDDGRYVGDIVRFNESMDSVEIESKTSEIESKPSEVESKPSDLEKVVKASGEEGGRVGVWWKIPLDLLKYCLFKASPVWSLSVAAAMMGVVILGRRLYRMKQKSRTLQLKVAVDDKKVSQVMSRAARLNEAFSVVKRAPIIRPSLPAAGITPWPVMALR
ncbi:hypothetical protein Hanom_Chr06g00566081 [Helianthus anomalus]